MANEGGGFNPANFYLGVVELFAILLPGAILTFVVYWSPFLSVLFGGDELSSRPLPDNLVIRVIGFAVVSYVVGHFLAALGYFVMEPLFGYYYASGRPGAVRLLAVAEQAYDKINDIVKVGDSRVEQFRWTVGYLNLYSPQASTRLDSVEAECKFFRNLTPAIVLSFPLIDSMYRSCCIGSRAEFLPIIILFLYPVWKRLFPSRSSRPLFFLCAALMIASESLCRPTASHAFVDAALYGFVLVGGLRYIALQQKLEMSAYGFFLLLTHKSEEAGNLGETHAES